MIASQQITSYRVTGIETIAHRMFMAGLVYALAIAYGSLLPFEFQQRSLDAALADYLKTPWFGAAAGNSLDLSMNLLLYIPLGFLLSGASYARSNRYARAAMVLVVFFACTGLSALIEFAQLYLPYRASVLTDLLANSVGVLVGCALWVLTGNQCLSLFSAFASGGLRALRVALVGYAVGVLFISLFPFVFLPSFAEVQQKLSGGNVVLFLATAHCQSWLRCSVKLVLEVLAVVPLGVLASLGSQSRTVGLGVALVGGALLGVFIEGLQLFLESGIVQGVSVFTRAAGVVLGVVMARSFIRRGARRIKLPLLPSLMLGASAYLLLVIGINGWFSREWAGFDVARAKFSDLNMMPFYYHFLTSETSAITSTLMVAAMYLPVGLLYWGWCSGRRTECGSGAIRAAWLGGGIALLVESAKLFQAGLRPDSANVLVAAVTASSAFAITGVVGKWLAEPRGVEIPPVPLAHRERVANRQGGGRSGAWMWSVPVFLAVVVAVYGYPVGAVWLALGLLAYAALLLRYPYAWLIAIPALLPLLDFARWTGRFFLDEFDLVVLVTLAVGLCRIAAAPGQRRRISPFAVFAAMVGLSCLASLVIGLYPLQPWDANAFSNYYSHYNALRVAKGILWAFALFLLGRSLPPSADIRRLFTLGLVAGLAGTIAVIAWERFTFTGLFNFSHSYRVTGPLSAVHTGGSILETYLVAVLPFLAFGMTLVRNPLLLLAGLLMLGGGIYGVMVTYSRTGYAALAVALTLMFVAFWLYLSRQKSDRVHRVAFALVFAITMVLVAVPVLKGSSAQSRLAQVELDLHRRVSHWKDAVTIMDAGWRSSVLGMGLGSYPRTYYLLSTENIRPGTYRYENENGNIFLRLSSGSPIFINQPVALKPYTNYVLSLDLRSSQNNAEFSIPICEKWLLGSFNCEFVRIAVKDGAGTWQHHEIAFNSKDVGAGSWYARRPIRLALNIPGGMVDVDNVRLLDEAEHNLVANGAFGSGNDRWLFTMDNHWPWHVENFWLHIFFEQGWFGVFSFAMLTAYAFLGAIKRMWRGDLFAGALVASIAGFLVIGVLNSPNDHPRLVFLFLLLCWLSYRIQQPARAPAELKDSGKTVLPSWSEERT